MYDVQYCKDALKTLEEMQTKANMEEKMAILLARTAIATLIPERVKPDDRYFGIGICPNCGAVFLDRSTNNCGNCGQAIIF